MSVVLTIDTANSVAFVGLFILDKCVGEKINTDQKDHASFIQKAIDDLLIENDLKPADLDYIACTSGPGSYTGLRVGVASAKGLAYGLDKPLILLNTLDVMASAAIEDLHDKKEAYLIAPSIDARRQDVFIKIVNADFSETVLDTRPMTIKSDSFDDLLKNKKIIFIGSGSAKIQTILQNATNAIYSDKTYNSTQVFHLAWQKIQDKDFADVAYSSPSYFKEFYTTQKQA